MPIWYIVALFYQSAIQSTLFVLYLRSKRPWPRFFLLWFLFVFVIFPFDNFIGDYHLFLKNVFNCVFLGFVCRGLFPEETKRRIVLAVLLYETSLVLCEIFGIPLMYLLTQKKINWHDFDSFQMIMTGVASGLMTVFVFGLLRVFSKTMTGNMKMLSYLGCLLVNNIVLVLCVCQILGFYEPFFFSLSYQLVVLILFGLNGAMLFSLARFVKQERQRQSLALLEETYHQQLLLYLQNGQQEEGWRRIRHDLINFLDEQSF